MLGGNQEVAIFKPLNDFEILLDVYIKIETHYDNIFKKLVEENVFGWLSAKGFEKSFITKSTHWMNSSELFKHENANYVVYYLIDETNKQMKSATTRTFDFKHMGNPYLFFKQRKRT